jgi:divalent metal cation (Fe/Co/Zn/Cd) transporter
MAGATPLDAAHRLSHDVKDRLMARYPQILDAIIHIEPPPGFGLTPGASPSSRDA